MKNSNDKNILILLPGLGAVATTFLAGIYSKLYSDKEIIGSITQNYKVEDGDSHTSIANLRELPGLENLRFAAWDIVEDNAYESALKANVLHRYDLEPVRKHLEAIKPMKGVFSKKYVKNLDGTHVKESNEFTDLVAELREDIRNAKQLNNTEEAVMIWCGSTESYNTLSDVHQSLDAFEKGIEQNDEDISPTQIYAYAALLEDVAFANGTPNMSVEIPALQELAIKNKLPIAGKDFKTGQTFLKTLIAPGLKAKLLGTEGWFSTNILGNKDGLVLNEPENFRNKESSKLESLNSIFEPDIYPELYGDLHHTVRINYYPPRGDAKEGWDNIDIFGWMNYPMQIKINFLCRDSILAAPIVLDLALLLTYSKERGYAGVQDWLSFYFKHPHRNADGKTVHDLRIQHNNLISELTELN